VTRTTLPGEVSLRLLAGRLDIEGQTLTGPINATPGHMSTDPLFVDLDLPPGARVNLPVAAGHNAFLYVYEGSAAVGGQALGFRQAGVLSAGDFVSITGSEQGARLILIAGRPIGEPIVQYGPFVMNTAAEIEQALADYRAGTLTG